MKVALVYVGLIIFFCFNAILSLANDEPISPIRAPKLIDLSMVELGKKLFYDRRLSLSGHLSCNSCHNISLGGVDNQQYSVGHHWQQGSINTPTVLNASLNFSQYWNGRVATLQEQARDSLENAAVKTSPHFIVVDLIETIPGYVTEFSQVFASDIITIDDVAAAIAEFEKTLVTPNARFDKWLLGDESAISPYELSGYTIFKSVGCAGCHNGPGVGGQNFQKLGLAEPYKTNHPARGRAEVSGKAEDENVFKVPLLRNIELTYPYFHDGAVNSLEEAVNIMARVQLGVKLGVDETERIVAFLKTLTGKQPSFPLPQLHSSGVDTPRPQPFNDASY